MTTPPWSMWCLWTRSFSFTPNVPLVRWTFPNLQVKWVTWCWLTSAMCSSDMFQDVPGIILTGHHEKRLQKRISCFHTHVCARRAFIPECLGYIQRICIKNSRPSQAGYLTALKVGLWLRVLDLDFVDLACHPGTYFFNGVVLSKVMHISVISFWLPVQRIFYFKMCLMTDIHL